MREFLRESYKLTVIKLFAMVFDIWIQFVCLIQSSSVELPPKEKTRSNREWPARLMHGFVTMQSSRPIHGASKFYWVDDSSCVRIDVCVHGYQKGMAMRRPCPLSWHDRDQKRNWEFVGHKINRIWRLQSSRGELSKVRQVLDETFSTTSYDMSSIHSKTWLWISFSFASTLCFRFWNWFSLEIWQKKIDDVPVIRARSDSLEIISLQSPPGSEDLNFKVAVGCLHNPEKFEFLTCALAPHFLRCSIISKHTIFHRIPEFESYSISVEISFIRKPVMMFKQHPMFRSLWSVIQISFSQQCGYETHSLNWSSLAAKSIALLDKGL